MRTLDDRVEHAGCRGETRLQTALADAGSEDAETAPRHPFGERAGRTLADQPPFVHQQDRAAPLGLVEIGRAEQHGHALAPHQPIDNRPQLTPRNRIDTDGRLVEQQETRRAHQGAGKTELLLHATGEPPDKPARERPEPGHMQQLVVPRRPVCGGNALEVGVEIEVFRDRQILIQPEMLRHVAEQGLHRERLGSYSDAKNLDTALIETQQPGDQPHQSGLAGAVRADQAGDAAALDAGTDVGQRRDGPSPGVELLGHLVQQDGRGDITLLRHSRLRKRKPHPRFPEAAATGRCSHSPACRVAIDRADCRHRRAADRRGASATPGFRPSWG